MKYLSGKKNLFRNTANFSPNPAQTLVVTWNAKNS
jgi:hypothetical protein